MLFAVSALIFYFADKCRSRWPIWFWIISLAGITLLSFVAGARDNSIGTDIRMYGYDTWQTAKYYLDDFTEGNGHIRRETVFVALNYLAASISTKYYGVVLFLICFTIEVFALLACARYTRYVPLWFSMTVFNLLNYNLDYNLMGQGVANAFCLWSMKYLEDKKAFKFMLCAVASYFFHHSAVVGYVALLGIYWALTLPEKQTRKMIVLAAICGVVGYSGFALATKWVAEHTSMDYTAYSNSNFMAGGAVPKIEPIVRLAMLSIVIVFFKRGYVQDKRLTYTLLFIFICDIASLCLGMYTIYAMRIGYYFSLYGFLMFPVFLSKAKIANGTKYLITGCYLSTIFFLFYWFQIVKLLNETHPYTSEFLDI